METPGAEEVRQIGRFPRRHSPDPKELGGARAMRLPLIGPGVGFRNGYLVLRTGIPSFLIPLGMFRPATSQNPGL